MSVTMDIILKRPSKVYHPGETIAGNIVVQNPSRSDVRHDGIVLQLEGYLSIQLSPKSAGIIDSLVNSPKPSLLHGESVEICKAGRFSPGSRTTEIPFEVTLPLSTLKKPIFETFHGNCINIQYSLRCTIKRSLLAKPLVHMTEFIVEQPTQPDSMRYEPIVFALTRNTVTSAAERIRLPPFTVTGQLGSNIWSLSTPLTGQVCVEECSGELISSIEVQLHRRETCGNPADTLAPVEVSEVQGWQVCDGDVARGLSIPICLPLPRAFTCVSTSTNSFAISFQVSIVVTFGNDHVVSESFPLTLVR